MRGAVERRALVAGGTLLAAALVFNRWFLALFAIDGSISSTDAQRLIWLIQGAFLALGTWVIASTLRARRITRLASIGHSLVLVTAGIFLASLALFGMLEVATPLLPTGFNVHPYYAVKAQYEFEPELGFRRRPHSSWDLTYKGEFFHPKFNFPIEPISIHAVHDANGHINHRAGERADVVVLGDSFVHYGLSAADTFGARLEMASGYTTHNLGSDGYGPPQYLIMFRRYAASLHPRVALFCFFEGNDILEMFWWADWHETGGSVSVQGYIMRANSGGFFSRYAMAVVGTFRLLASIQRAIIPPPELVEIDLGGRTSFVMFYFMSEARSPEALLKRREWRDLGSVLQEFKRQAAALNIVPVVIFIPTAEHVYGALTTSNSSRRWLESRETELAAAGHTEDAVSALAASQGLRVISLTAPFKARAASGLELYYPLDSHWNSAGREVAAKFIAEELGKAELATRPEARWPTSTATSPAR